MSDRLDAQRLTAILTGARWFGHKGRVLESISVWDRSIIEDGPPELVLALLETTFTDGSSALYQVPVLVDPDGNVRDALEEPDRLRVLGDLMAYGHTLKGDEGSFEFGGAGLDPSAPPGHESIRVMTAEQSNSSIVFDDKTILKLFRRLDMGPNPDIELNQVLTSEGFDHVPPQVGDISYHREIDGDDVVVHLGLAQHFIPDAADGWDHVLAHLRALYDQIDPADAREDITSLIRERSEEVLRQIAELGEATAALHVVLAREGFVPDIAPEPITSEDLGRWATESEASCDVLADAPVDVDPDAAKSRIAQLRDVSSAGMKIRIHGDFHLGQVMWTPRGWMITDFEGEPARAMEKRRAKHSALKDVAGMLRSFSYAATAALFERADPGSDSWAQLEPWAIAWEELARSAFVDAYLSKSHEGTFLPADRDDISVMGSVFELEKALYELEYEMGNRPDWARIPARGIERVLAREHA